MKSRRAPNYIVALLWVLSVSAFSIPAAMASSKHTPHPATSSVAYGQRIPAAGMSMAQVKRYYGNPASVRKSRGPVKKQWPRITGWHYGRFTVYFERNKVLHTVIH